ncbi:cupin domain-containing protein [bacterium]|nr:cupin domain-containing protein [bacterium]
MRRIVTAVGAGGKSAILIDGPPSSEIGSPDIGGLFEIWHDLATGPLDPAGRDDLGESRPVLAPASGKVKVRWFVVTPTPDDVPVEVLNEQTRQRFADFDGDHHIVDQTRHPAMHTTHSIDVICLLKGEVSLILDDGETQMKPGQVVIQRGTNHAWRAHGGPALLLAVLIDRPLNA